MQECSSSGRALDPWSSGSLHFAQALAQVPLTRVSSLKALTLEHVAAVVFPNPGAWWTSRPGPMRTPCSYCPPLIAAHQLQPQCCDWETC